MAGNNNSGRRPGPQNDKPWLEMLRLELFDADRKKLRDLAKIVVCRALAGDMAAIKEIADRLDGKPVQVIDGMIEHEHNFVRAPEKATDEEWNRYLEFKNKPPPVPVKRVGRNGNHTNGRNGSTSH